MPRSTVYPLLILLLLAACKPADKLMPRWTVRQAPPAEIILGDTLPPVVLEVLDNRDCRLDDAVVADGFVDTRRWGDYELMYRVADEAGNETDTAFSVRVVMAPESYWATRYDAVDTCGSDVLNYQVAIQDCDCPEPEAQLFNLGNFGPGSYVNILLNGDYRATFDVARSTSTLDWSGSGRAVPTGDTLYVQWEVDNGATPLACRTRLVQR
jgi:hypothetical protein